MQSSLISCPFGKFPLARSPTILDWCAKKAYSWKFGVIIMWKVFSSKNHLIPLNPSTPQNSKETSLPQTLPPLWEENVISPPQPWLWHLYSKPEIHLPLLQLRPPLFLFIYLGVFLLEIIGDISILIFTFWPTFIMMVLLHCSNINNKIH